MPGFRYLLRVRYAECDAQKIVFNARYGDYVDLAATEYLRALWGTIDGPDLDYRLVRQLTEWRAPARFDDVLELRVRTQNVGTTSFTLATALGRWGGSAEPAVALATSETVYVMVDVAQGRKRPVPTLARHALERGSDAMIDHAGALAGGAR